jgi:galactose mutarotase-like enzyme
MAGAVMLRCGALTAEISPVGAEIRSLRHAGIGEFIWQASTDSWRRQSPVLFPIIGRYPRGLVTIGGAPLDMTPHGFAPDLEFALVGATAKSCDLELCSGPVTRASYDFDFRLSVRHELRETGLRSSFTVTNPSETQTLPFMIGGHPGFCWPLPQAGARESHSLRFAEQEQLSTSVLSGIERARPGQRFDGQQLCPSEMDFVGKTHALIGLNSRAVTFGTEQVFVTLSYEGLGNLALWTRDEAAFLCLEPWSNMPMFVDTPTEMADLADMTLLPAGQSITFSIEIALGGTRLRAEVQN